MKEFHTCCKTILEDNEFCAIDEIDKNLKDIVRKILSMESDNTIEAFSSWLQTQLKAVVDYSVNKKKTIDREKLWTKLYEVRCSEDFQGKWKAFCAAIGVSYEPVLFQHITDLYVKAIVESVLPLPETPGPSVPNELTCEEESAVRYVCGYLLKKLKVSGICVD